MQIRDRDRAITNVEQILHNLSKDPKSGVQFVPDSRWMAIFRETAFQVSTRHGHPLHPKDKEEKHSQPFPWKGLAYLRWACLCSRKVLWLSSIPYML